MDPNANPPANANPPSNPPPANPPPANDPPPSNPPPANPPANQPATPPAGNPPPENKPGENKPPENKPDDQGKPPAAPGDLFDMLKGEEQKTAEAKEKAQADFAAYFKEAGLGEEIGDLTLGKDENAVTLAAEDVGAVIGALKATEIPAAQAKGVLATIGMLDRIRAERQEAEENKVVAEIQEASRQEFGDNLRTVLGDAQAAGLALFGADLWQDISTIKALTNDKRFLRAMAAYGRSRRNDTGGPAPSVAAAPGGEKTFDLATFAKGMK